ncbi:2-(1,2-epoxy-1,2-dihydrophenyl)acetyl-CoA isomerase PaaG [Sphingomonas sp. KR1UV-12]|uniref:2-(1,2-epoxy-1,2-dihydrophenyl)acetyl-CoA isomerase PaaG n=1 Tax=Sphingomonas aurea TaxID=3063994 RepID=A0ABT9ELU3_9SPHN|nr:2-(1,2-epoxy-1,2-dihydrophenyl)acetyl-CoA isomerase PaaG [Sphingomonas sp. KR1UV-12]MDP1027608.1 2-(1,2-epoxy-1,2-dihydrophenyl)acetyl-CoA isomerase PaaG [Sphingomonas sp. KR1UV-12]
MILVERANGVARVTLNRPERLNSFTAAMHGELAAALDRIAEDGEVRAVLLTGAGRGFCAGQDLSDRVAPADGTPIDLGESIERHYAPLIRRLTILPKPVVCAVNGVAAGAGVSVALACDIVVAGRSAKFIQSFAKVGLIPDSGGTWVLPRLVGQARALGLALTGDALSAERAAAWGLIWDCVDDDALIDTATALAERLAAGPAQGLAETKRLIRAASGTTLDAQLDAERDAMRVLGCSDDYREGVAAFLGKRAPVFGGTRN